MKISNNFLRAHFIVYQKWPFKRQLSLAGYAQSSIPGELNINFCRHISPFQDQNNHKSDQISQFPQHYADLIQLTGRKWNIKTTSEICFHWGSSIIKEKMIVWKWWHANTNLTKIIQVLDNRYFFQLKTKLKIRED